ncbi:hypothetical protein GF325_10650 [Candidatus Bathyarchaeota archaeon]|nr:hypothetical protein [Candidatus Bathyarchaeota archaeon]
MNKSMKKHVAAWSISSILCLMILAGFHARSPSYRDPTFETRGRVANQSKLLFNLTAEEMANNYTTGSQRLPDVAMLSNDTFVVAWVSPQDPGSNDGIYASIFNVTTGHNITSEFRVNTEVNDEQVSPSVVALTENLFVVAWESYFQDGDQTGVYAKLFNSTGNNVTGEFRVNINTPGYQNEPSVAKLTDNKFVVTWSSALGDSDGYGILARIYNGTGSPLTGELPVNDYETSNQRHPSVVGLNGTHFAVTWSSANQDGNNYGVFATVLDDSGANSTDEFQVNTHITGPQEFSEIARLNETSFVITWESDGQDGDGKGVYSRVFNVSGSALSAELPMNNHTINDQVRPKICALANESFLVTWESALQDPLSNSGVYATIFDVEGQNLTREFRVNTNTTDGQGLPAVASLNDTSVVVTWVSFWQDGDQGGVYFQGYEFVDVPPQNVNLVTDAGSPDVDGSFALNWSADGADNFSLYQDDAPITAIDAFSLVYLGLTNDSCTLSRPNGTYYFAVLAINESGSTLSNNVQVEVSIPPAGDNGPNKIPGFNVGILFGILAISGVVLVLFRAKVRKFEDSGSS